MKKFLKILSIGLILILALMFFIPILFKDKIKARVDQEIANHIDAQIYIGDFGLTLFRNFPNLTIQLDQFGVVGNGVFARDTLAGIQRLNIVVDLMSVFKGEQIQIRKFILDQPRIHAIILPDGKANWDIYKGSSTDTLQAEEDTTASAFSLALNTYALNDAYIRYDDRQGKMFARINNLTHSGSGDFTSDTYLLKTLTKANGIFFKMDGESYASNMNVDAQMDLDIDMASGMYIFRDNQLKLNQLPLQFDGFVQMAGDDIRMDLKFAALKSEFKHFLSVVPGMYTQSFDDIKASGTLALSGAATGTYNDKRLPAFHLNLKIENAAFKYPDLPEDVRNIQVDLSVQNKNGNISDTDINLRAFHADFGNNPIDASGTVKGLENMQVDAKVIARMNLEEMMRIFPMEGMELKGIFDLNATAKGIYSDKSMPVIDAIMKLDNGFLKSADFPSAIENLSFSADMQSDGSMNNTRLAVTKLHAEIDNEPVDMRMQVVRFDDPEFEVQASGALDFDKLMKIYPLEDTELKGRMNFALNTKGKMSDVEAERYLNIPTSGSMKIQNLTYKSIDLPQGLTITEGDFEFTPANVKINKYTGSVGSSKISLSGAFHNYLAWALSDNQPLKGNLSLTSPKFNVNEWMTDDEGSDASAEEAPLSPVEVPAGIEFVFNADINEVLYDNLVLKNMKGVVKVKDQTVAMENVRFNMLDGAFVMGGTYNASNMAKPAYDFALNIQNLNIRKAYDAFNTVQLLAPAAKFVEGNFNSDMKIGGLLGMDMMPLMETFTGLGSMLVFNGVVSDMPITQKLSEATKFAGGTKTIQIKDKKISFRIENGKIHFDPFDVNAGEVNMTISGSTGFDQSILYLVKVDAPSGAAGQAANAAVSGLTGGQKIVGNRIKADVRLGGTFNQPKILGVKSDGDGAAGQVGDAIQDKVGEVKDKAMEEAERLKREAEDRARQEADRLKREAEDRARNEANRLKGDAEAKARQEADRLKKEAEDKARKEAERLKQEAEKRAREEAEKKAKEEAERKAKEEAEKLKNKLKFPK
jgi:uncharacterized protein involved in outer membrane biogenesis